MFSLSLLSVKSVRAGLLVITLLVSLHAVGVSALAAMPGWSAKFDSRVRFYQTTELGVLIVGTEKSLYAVDGETGDVLWRRKSVRLDETDVAPVPGTDLLLLSFERGNNMRIEAADILRGDAIWQSNKVRGSVMQMAVDLEANLLAVVVAREAKGRAREGFKRHPSVHVFDLGVGRELWKYEIKSDVEMMPARWSEKETDDTAYTLDNYRAPVFLEGQLYLFYEGITVLDARTGKERLRERFRVNEENLALTEADPIFDEQFVYTSGRGRVRAISPDSGRIEWESKDLGLTPEMILADNVLYVRTGGQFTRLQDGETVERGPYGVSAIDVRSGRTLWRYKGADRGITNITLADQSTVLMADRDELSFIDTRTGKRRARISHGVEQAAFVLINEQGQAVVGGRSEIAAFDVVSGERIWRERHDPPGRGLLRTMGAIVARAASLYFRYGGAATTAFRGVQLARAASTLRWSGLAARLSVPDLSTLASGAAREYVAERFAPYGVAARAARQSSLQRVPRISRPSVDVEERLLDRLDPAHQLDRLARFLWRRRRLATLRGEWMYFYTDLQGQGGRGLAGVNVNTGRVERAVRLSDPDERFISDEATGLLYSSKDERLFAYSINGR